jgi:5-methylcytosine-specific restriction endonuclease McrA
VVYTGPPFVRKPKINKNPIPKRRGSLKSGQCKVCSSWFVSCNVNVTCSAKCQRTWKKRSPNALESKRVQKARRRALQKNAFVENVSPKQIFARDRYRCQLRLAGCKGIDQTKLVPHPKAPTTDHIIPLSKGGTHEPKNCHTACFHCNWKKSNGGGGEQLLLIG